MHSPKCQPSPPQLRKALLDANRPEVGNPRKEAASGTFTWRRRWKDYLPEGAYDKGVAEVADRLNEMYVEAGLSGETSRGLMAPAELEQSGRFKQVNCEPLPFQCAAGPAVKEVSRSSSVMWLFFLVLPWVTLPFCRCPDGNGLATYPLWLWAIILPFELYFIWNEFRCLSYIIIPVVQTVGKLPLLVWKVEYPTWVACTSLVSFASHMDIATNSLFFAVCLGTMPCHAGRDLERTWEKVLEQSMFWWLSWMPFTWLGAFLWVCMIGQAFFGWVRTLPVQSFFKLCRRLHCETFYWRCAKYMQWTTESPEVEVDYSLRDADYAYRFVSGGTGGTLYETITSTKNDDGKRQFFDHGVALVMLSQTARMVSISSSRLQYSKTKIAYYLAKSPPLCGPPLTLLRTHLEMVQFRALFLGILESAIQINVQGTLLALNFNLSGSGANPELCFSLFVGSVASLKTIYDMFSTMNWVHAVVYIDGLGNTIRSSIRGATRERYLSILKSVKRKLFCLACLVLFWLTGLIYAWIKILAVWVCPESTWNLHGCAKVKNHEDTPHSDIALMVLFFMGFMVALKLLGRYLCACDHGSQQPSGVQGGEAASVTALVGASGTIAS